MPSLAVVEASNAAFSPGYVPVIVVVGGTSGVGQAMAEALARQTKGHAHIIIVGRNATAAERILASFPKPTESDGWAHEFVQCDASSMASVRVVCAYLSARLKTINFLIFTAGGPAANSLMESSVTPEGLNSHLAMRYFMRYLFTKELLPLVVCAKEIGQHAHVMTVLGAGFGMPIRTTDLGIHEAQSRSIKLLQGIFPSAAAVKGLVAGVGYNDGLVAHFAALHPELAFTHIQPGQVLTEGGSSIPLGWFFGTALLDPQLPQESNLPHPGTPFKQDECAKYMIYGLLDVERGLFIRDNYGNIISAHVFNPDLKNTSLDLASPTAQKFGVLNGVPMKGYGGSDASVAALIEYTEQVLATIH
ncbi:hypothetical protein MSAN_00428800 [Mycena sanguinolenta]|uniref:NAD(P)-binding protein n=1 Tax=Mycena sanguinolenta TaxID=230812 RepID=A0A8H6ZDK1_9AGAR|nr:hypothetical protein MSAN_00428800 [Mycena sanguinolenta]